MMPRLGMYLSTLSTLLNTIEMWNMRHCRKLKGTETFGGIGLVTLMNRHESFCQKYTTLDSSKIGIGGVLDKWLKC